LERGNKLGVLKAVQIRNSDQRSSDFVERVDLISRVNSSLNKTVSGGDLRLKGGYDTTSNRLDGFVDLKIKHNDLE
jgi:hypothetical protein